ncbi:hypothetical protein GNP89_12465 [Aliivibrio fischeri]|uniref:hypothetical protein n=1 Tax=Aliivibrio fischeri TaxID=668 RepID=UPI0012D96A13|nr:hypothetical protein [Aliivibrio fischeri]MUL03000.1 hypothetical protein [Aliivibrio fischeri]
MSYIIETVTIIAMIAAVIAAIPTAIGWLPTKLSNKERNVLLLAKGDSGYPYMILFVCGITKKAYVQTPFKHDTTTYISDELVSLTCKKLIKVAFLREGGAYSGDGQFVWYMLTRKGIDVLNKISKS